MERNTKKYFFEGGYNRTKDLRKEFQTNLELTKEYKEELKAIKEINNLKHGDILLQIKFAKLNKESEVLG